jgi:broad specificity phosphatase PhoE
MVTIVFEAHGTTFDNEAHRSSGHYDVELSPLGIKQSHEMGERYKDDHFDAIFCSDLQRAYKSAELGFGDKFPIIKDARLRECDYGDLTQHPSEEVDAEKPKRIQEPFPNGESYAQTALRMLSFLDDLGKNYDGKRIMIIGHRATQYGLNQWIKGMQTYDAVTAPWKWQPGWTYYFHVMPEPYKVRMGYVTLGHEIHGLTTQFEAFDKEWFLKREFHVSLICVKIILPQLFEKHDKEKTNTLLSESLIKVLSDYKPSFESFTGELRTAKDGDKETIVAMCNVKNLNKVFEDLSSALDLPLELPPTHITLYTMANKKAIGIATKEELETLTTKLEDEEIKDKMNFKGIL